MAANSTTWYFQWLKDGKVGMTGSPPRDASRRGTEIGRVALDREEDAIPASWNSDAPSVVVLWAENDSFDEPFDFGAPELPSDSTLLEGLFASAVRRRFPAVALGAASALMATDFFGFLNLATVLLPLEAAMHVNYRNLLWIWAAAKCGRRPSRIEVERTLKIVRECAGSNVREKSGSFESLLDGAASPKFDAKQNKMAVACVQPLLFRVLADAGATSRGRARHLVRSDLRLRAWTDSLFALAATWQARCDSLDGSGSRWEKELFSWHENMKPIHTETQYYGPDLWETFQLPEAVCAKIDAREAEFCREALELGGHELPAGTTYQEVSEGLIARWRDATPRTSSFLEEEPETPESLSRFGPQANLAFGLALPGLECLAHRRWNLPLSGKQNAVGPPNKKQKTGSGSSSSANSEGEPFNPLVAKFAKPKPKNATQKTIWDFLRS